jgi:hypothetical protein
VLASRVENWMRSVELVWRFLFEDQDISAEIWQNFVEMRVLHEARVIEGLAGALERAQVAH